MLLLFTKNYGKISAGSSIGEKGRNKAALAVRPFTYGVYELYKGRETYNVNSAEVRKSFFRIGEDVDKYMYASMVLELTEKLLPEELPQPRLFQLLLEFLTALENREKKQETLVLAYQVKAISILGAFPVTDRCACCGKTENLRFFSVKDGGMICTDCANRSNDTLIYEPKFDIVNILKYFSKTSVSAFEKIALDRDAAAELWTLMREYMTYHFDIGKLKSDSIFGENF